MGFFFKANFRAFLGLEDVLTSVVMTEQLRKISFKNHCAHSLEGSALPQSGGLLLSAYGKRLITVAGCGGERCFLNGIHTPRM